MRYLIIPVTPLQQNCTLMWDETTNKAAVSDPGGDIDRIAEQIEKYGVTLEKILITHGHQDHCGRAKELADRYNVPIEGPNKKDEHLLQILSTLRPYTPNTPQSQSFTSDRWLNQGDTVTVGNETLQVFHCPGHTPGHVAYYHAPTKVLISGDVLFKSSVGRTDLPGSSFEALEKSIQENLYTLPDDVHFVPGHGEISTIGFEKHTNPFVRAKV